MRNAALIPTIYKTNIGIYIWCREIIKKVTPMLMCLYLQQEAEIDN